MSNFYKPNYNSLILIVDGAHALRRAMYQPSYRELSTSKGMPTGAIYGMCRILCSLKSNIGATSLVVSLEGGHSKRRTELYPDYKKREGVDEVSDDTGMTDYQYYMHQQSWVRKLLECLGIPVISVPGKEGDDVIFQMTHLLKGEKMIVSEDRDFFTLIDKDTSVFRPVKGQLVNLDTFVEVVGYNSPLHYLYSKVLLGDGSDNIPSVAKGVGEKTVSDILNNIPVNDLNLSSIKKEAASYGKVRYQRVADMEDSVFTRNVNLIDMSREPFTVPELLDIVSDMKRDTQDMATAMKLMSVLEFGEGTRSDLMSLGNMCKVSPVSLFLDESYIKDVMSGSSNTILGGNL